MKVHGFEEVARFPKKRDLYRDDPPQLCVDDLVTRVNLAAVLRMKDQGVSDPKRGTRGHMYVHVKVTVPNTSNPKARKLVEELGQLEPDPRMGKF